MELSCVAARAGRLSGFLKGELGLSTGLMNRLKFAQRVYVNGVSRRADFQVLPGDTVTVLLDEPEPAYPAEEMPLTILYEDAFLLAVDKPAGMLIHPSRHRDTGTLANGVAWYYRQTGQPCAFHPATRLDRDTFGVVLLGKNSHIHGKLNELHAQGALVKTYEALVFGGPEADSGEIDLPIRRRPKPSLLREVAPDGQQALTRYRVLERGVGWSRLALEPVTGRTHQLRVHCAALGFPILGDPQYGTEESLALSRVLGYGTQQLLAARLRLPHPMTGETLVILSKMALRPPQSAKKRSNF